MYAGSVNSLTGGKLPPRGQLHQLPLYVSDQKAMRAKLANAFKNGTLHPTPYATDGGPGSTAEPYTVGAPKAKRQSPLAAAAAAGAPAAGMDPYSSLLPGTMTPAQIQAIVTKSVGAYPAGMTTNQIQTEAQGEISPLIAAITDSITGQTRNAVNAIRGYSTDLASKLAGINFAAPYTTGEQAQAAVDAGLQSALTGAGNQDAQDLASRLAVINDPTVQTAANAVAQNGVANAGTQVAQGSNALGSLIAQAAAAGTYGKKLTGIAGLTGVQQIGQTEQNAQNQIGSQTQQVEAQLPSILSSLRSESDQNATNRAQAGTSLLTSLLSSSDSNATNRAQLAEDWAKYQGAQAAATAQAEGKDAAEVAAAAIKAEQAATTAATKASAPSPSLSRANGYLTDNSGQPITDGNGRLRPIAGYKVAPNGQGVVSTKAAAGSKAKSLTPEQINTLIQQWHDGKAGTKRVLAPKPDANGNPVYQTRSTRTGQLSYPQAVKRLTQLNGGDRDAAMQVLDTVYKRGDLGRAWLTNAEQQTLSSIGLKAGAYRYKSLAFLLPSQAKALQAAGGLPPGSWLQQAHTQTKDLGPIYVLDEAF